MLNFFHRLNFLPHLGHATNERKIRKLRPLVQRINDLEKEMLDLSDTQLQERTPWLKERLHNGESLDALLPDAFATVREASNRVLGMRPYDVQLMGGIILHQGHIAEMKTGEGKTLVATMPVYLNALTGKGVHIVTVNDYLATRDQAWMSKLYNFLGMSSACVVHNMGDDERRQAYAADITHGTNGELGFDYLRDNMKVSAEERVLRPFSYVIVDEVDSILIDEARTPLIISGPAEDSSELYVRVNTLIGHLREEDFEKDEKNRSVHLTESGMERLEALVKEKGLIANAHLYETENLTLVHHINQALKAHKNFTKDVDYIVKDDKVMLVDEFTGRIMDGRRYSDGLHQALEAKEGVKVEIENQTLASVTYQNFFRLYPKLAGMTGTAITDAEEFHTIYKLGVTAIPTNKPIAREDKDDEVYRTLNEKKKAILKLIQTVHAKGQPILLGTVSIEKSELFSALLKQHRIPHQVLNARQHAREAEIIAEAGAPKAITIATNMAGRGTDIKLGGNLDMRLEKALEGVTSEAEKENITKKIRNKYAQDKQKVLESGGLFIIGTERHESRRIDNQLRGRAGRQGDPGASQFFLCLEDDLMRIFGSEKLDEWLLKLGLKEDEAITHPWINRALEKAQQRVEARNFDVRKHLLKYDDIMNEQRKIVYGWRDQLIKSPAQGLATLTQAQQHITQTWIDAYAPQGTYQEDWQLTALQQTLFDSTHIQLDIPNKELTQEALKKLLHEAIQKARDDKKQAYGETVWEKLVGQNLLQSVDHGWKNHLYALDHLRQGVHLRSYAQKDPFSEYASEAFRLFQQFLLSAKQSSLEKILKIPTDIDSENTLSELADRAYLDHIQDTVRTPHEHTQPTEQKQHTKTNPDTQQAGEAPPARNAPCPCGSGKRYKNCHGVLT